MRISWRPWATPATSADPAPRHAVRQHGRGQGHRQRRTDLGPAAPRRTLLRHLPLPPPQWRRAVDRGHLPAADQSGRRGRAHLGRLAQVHRRRRAAGRGAPAAAGHQRDRQRRGRVRPGRPHRLRQRGLSPHARLRPRRRGQSGAGRTAGRRPAGWRHARRAGSPHRLPRGLPQGRAGLRSRRQAAMGVCHGQLRVRRARHAGQRGGCADRYHPDQGA